MYLPAQRVACTPLGDRLRVAGMMEFRSPEARLDERRVQAIAAAARPFLAGRTSTPAGTSGSGRGRAPRTGSPSSAPRRSPRVYAAGGHGMWGITLGPATGRLLAEQMVSGRTPAELAPFSPTR